MTVEDGIAIVTLDQKGSKMNTLNSDFAPEAEALLDKIESDPEIQAAVFVSGKPDNFIAGADINMFPNFKTADDFSNAARAGHAVFERLEGGKPKVAAVNGTCMGGGLEFALACGYRVGTSHPKTVLSLPEVMLGLLPGAGGTQRLPALIGLKDALPIILTGKNVRANKAKKLGMLDEVVDPNALLHAAKTAARGLADGSLRPKRGPKGRVAQLTKWATEEFSLGRDKVFEMARKGVMKQTRGKYPAPLKICDVLEESVKAGFGSKTGYEAEATAFGELGMTPESAACVSIFFGQTACKKNPYGKPVKPTKKVGVIGAGLMGAGVAEVTVKKGLDVVLKDATPEGLGRGLNGISKTLKTGVKRRAMTQFEADKTMSRVMGLSDADAGWQKHFADVDMIIEAVFENLELKHRVIAEYESATPSHCIFASNTSAIPIGTLAEGSSRPDKFVGMHYFSPVPKMPLIEIIPHAGTSKETLAAAYAMGLKQGKTPIVVKDVPGFFVNRCLGPYSDEGMALLLDGAGVNDINEAMLDYGFPVGPMSLLDEVGIDVGASVQKNLKEDLGVRVGTADPAVMDRVLEAGWLGRKTGKGLFVYPPGGGKGKKEVNQDFMALVEEVRKARGIAPSGLTTASDIQMRMASRFVNEAALCLQDGIIESPTVGDIGSVFGIGFPPFRGGPFRLLDSHGTDKFVDQMLAYRDQFGEQFEPAQILKDYAKSGNKFHP